MITFNDSSFIWTSPDIVDRISNKDRHVFSLIVNCAVCLTVSFLGIVANVINITVFIRQGFSSSINVSFLCLAIADLGSLVFLLWRDVLYFPQIEDSALPVDPIPFMYMTASWPHIYFVRVSSWITAFITLERCLCIAMPLKVKTLITPRRVVFIHLMIYLLVMASIAPMYYTAQLTWKFYPGKNRSLVGLWFPSDRNEVESVALMINGNVIPMGALLVNVVCTTILIIRLKFHSNWRNKQATAGNATNSSSGGVSSRDAKIIAMAVTISTIYIICFGPVSFVISWMTVDPEFRLDGLLRNSLIVGASIAYLLEGFNSSVNFVVYYNMSSKFKTTLFELFRFNKSRPENTER